MSTPRALVLEAPGINCDVETAHAIQQAGGEAVGVHISELLAGDERLSEFDIFMLSGGFSYGDTIRSGAILGRKLRERFTDELNRFVELGKPVVGICNGFQTLIEAGLLPDGQINPETPKQASLIYNQQGGFECRWTPIKVGESACQFITPEYIDTLQKLPVAHGEGRFVMPGVELDPSQVVFSYASPDDGGVAIYPDNPNGSPDGITGICDPSGIVLGMMPHPERAIRQEQYQGWRRGEGADPFGAALFRGIVAHAQSL